RRIQEIVDPDGLAIRRSWTYDANGNAVTSTDARGQLTRYAYDAADRLVYTVDPLGYVRSSRYDAAGRVDLTIAYADAIDVAKLGMAISMDAVRALVSRDSIHDLRDYRVFDDDGRIVATVDGTGGVTRFWYDANGNVTLRKAYANRIDLGAWTEHTVPNPAADATRDRMQVTVYDVLDRPVYTMDGTGAVVAQAYDANGNLLERVAYAERISPKTVARVAEMQAALAGAADAAYDRRERYAYDAAGRLASTVDAMGAVTRRYHDANGNVVRQVVHAATVAAGSSAASVVAGSADRVSSMAYDAAGRMVFQVDAMNAVTWQAFDADGRVVERTSLATALAKTPGLGASVAALEAAVTEDAALDRQVRYAYDAAGRRIYE
ncbi:MAG: hypothetical protein EOO24_58055, partial [Comamonadaceae bacterium]